MRQREERRGKERERERRGERRALSALNERERSIGRLKDPGCEMTGGEYTHRVCWIASFKAHNASLSQFRC